MSDSHDLLLTLTRLRAELGEAVYRDALSRARVAVARAALEAAREGIRPQLGNVVSLAEWRTRRQLTNAYD